MEYKADCASTADRHTVIDTEELGALIAEAFIGKQRPVDATASQALDGLGETGNGFRKAALVAAEYIAECMNASGAGIQVRKVRIETETEQ